MADKQPYVVPEGTSRTMGRDAQRNNILAAKIVADIVKTTLGPKGMDKMLVDSSGNIIITNDGVTILEEMEIDHPAAKMMVEIAKTQESEVGDGTTTAALLAGKLLEKAEGLLDKNIHPTVIVKGYRFAAERALAVLNEISLPVSGNEYLMQIAMTAMTGKGAESSKEYLSSLIVKAVEQVSERNRFDLEQIKLEKVRGEDINYSELVQGIVLDREKAHSQMLSVINEAKILLLDVPLEIHGPETEAKISVSTPEQLEQFLTSEESYLKGLTEKVVSSGANVLFCQKGIDDVVQYYLAKAGIFACRRIPRSEMEQLARAISARIVSNIHEISEEQLGKAEIVEEVKMGYETRVFVRGCVNPKVVSILLRGGSEHVLDEVERAVKDGLGDVRVALISGRVVAGGGAVEVELSKRLRAFAITLTGREQLAVEAFAQALESIPETLAENAGLDPIDILTELRKRHEMGEIRVGLNLFDNEITDTFAKGIIEPVKVKTQAISSATEVATMILRIDDVLISGKGAGAKTNFRDNPDDD